MIIRYYPEVQSSNRDFEAMNYQMIDEKWSGWIDLFTYDEHYVRGYRLDEGELTHTREMQVNAGNAKKGSFGPENMDEAIHCYVVSTDWYDGNTGEYLDTTHAQTCEWQRGGSRGGQGSGGGHDDGPERRGPDDGGPGCSSCYEPPELPEPNLRVELDKSIKKNDYIRCIVGKLQLSNFVKDLALFDGTVRNGRNVILKIGETDDPRANAETSDELGPYRIEITLNQNRLNRNSLELARTILHELIHAELYNAIFHKNGSPIDNNFEANFSKYVALYSGDTEVQHNYMAENMVGKMAHVLSQIHANLGKESFLNDPNVQAAFPKGLPRDFYHGIAWGGLKWTDKWGYDLPSRNTYINYQEFGNESLKNECN
ncbi:hypothetical protein [Algoriphagus namhaensis]